MKIDKYWGEKKLKNGRERVIVSLIRKSYNKFEDFRKVYK